MYKILVMLLVILMLFSGCSQKQQYNEENEEQQTTTEQETTTENTQNEEAETEEFNPIKVTVKNGEVSDKIHLPKGYYFIDLNITNVVDNFSNSIKLVNVDTGEEHGMNLYLEKGQHKIHMIFNTDGNYVLKSTQGLTYEAIFDIYLSDSTNIYKENEVIKLVGNTYTAIDMKKGLYKVKLETKAEYNMSLKVANGSSMSGITDFLGIVAPGKSEATFNFYDDGIYILVCDNMINGKDYPGEISVIFEPIN